MPAPRHGRASDAATPSFDFEGGATPAAPAAVDAVHFVDGPRELAAELRRRFAARRAALRADARLLGRTLLVVVPSHHLGRQVQALLAADGALGVRVATASQAASDVLARAGRAPKSGAAWYDAIVRSVVRSHPRATDAFISGEGSWSLLGATIGDLLDAGLDDTCADAAHEALDEHDDDRERLLIELALAVQAALDDADCGRIHARYAQAAEVLRAPGARAGCDEALLCGFADATGHLGSFLAELQRVTRASVVWDAAQAGRARRGERFGRALREALGAGLAPEGAAAPQPRLLRASTRQVEARAIAAEIHQLVLRGVRPEALAIVVKHHDIHSARIGRMLRELGVPTASSAMRRDASTRPLLALADAFEFGPDASLKAFCTALGERRPDVRLGLSVLGLRTVGELAAPLVPASFDGDGVRLPVRISSAIDATDEKEDADPGQSGEDAANDEAAAARDARVLPRRDIERLHAAAQEFLAAWSGATPTGGRAPSSAALLGAWIAAIVARVAAAAPEAAARVEARLAALEDACPRREFATEDLRRVLCRELRQAAEDGPAAGGGVVLATASQLRSCAFERLYLPLCEHGRWPRVPREDPLLSDAARRALQAVLPALSCKLDGREEEAGLRASFWRAAACTVVSHARLDEDGKEIRPSAWFEDCAAEGAAVEDVHDTVMSADGGPQPLRTAREHARRGAILLRLRRPEVLAAVHASCIEDARARHGLPPADARAVADARLAWLLECEAPRAARTAFSPLLGKDCSLPAGPLHATTVEGYVKCPWQTLLVRGLKLRAPLDPEADLPTVDARLLGVALHAAAALLAPRQGGRLADLLDAPGTAHATNLEEAVGKATRDTLRAEGLAGRGLEPLLKDRVGALLRQALEFAPKPAVHGDGWVAAELDGEWDTGLPRLGKLRFRADRLERHFGKAELVDLKTGKPLHGSGSKDPKLVHKALRKQLRRGRVLQGALYALASGTAARYDHMVDDEERNDNNQYRVDMDEADLRAAALGALSVIDEALAAGLWLPRLVDADGLKSGPACARCEVALACRQGDSAAAHRVRAIVEHERLQPEPSALLRLWDLPAVKEDA